KIPGDYDLVLVHEVRECAVPFGTVADDGGGLAVARSKTKRLQRRVDAFIGSRISTVYLPIEGLEHSFELRHREYHAAGDIELAVIAVHHHAKVIQVLLAGEHDGLPDGTFLQLAIARHAIGIEVRPEFA